MEFIERLKTEYGIELNPQQQRAAETVDGAVLLLAVPGSGKTTVLIARLANMLQNHGIKPHKILTITFSRRSAADMQERYARYFGAEGAPRFSTIHSFCYGVVKHISTQYHRPLPRMLPDPSDTVRRLYCELEGARFLERDRLDDLVNRIGFCKNRLADDRQIEGIEVEGCDFPRLYHAYESYKKENHLMDYDDMLVFTYDMFRKNPSFLAQYHAVYSHINVDEAQDTSLVQHRIIQQLAQKSGNLFLVGDEDQSIYGFRGAFPDALLRFEEDHPDALVLKMERNYRSTGEIVKAANRLIRQNTARIDKQMTAGEESGVPVRVEPVRLPSEQYPKLAEWLAGGTGSAAVLYRYNESAIPLVDALSAAGIKFCLKDTREAFFQTVHVRDMTAFLKLAVDPTDFDSFAQIYNKTCAYFNRSVLDFVSRTHPQGADVFETLKRCPAAEPGKTASLRSQLERLRGLPPVTALNLLGELTTRSYFESDTAFQRLTLLKSIAARQKTVEELLNRLEELQGIVRETPGSGEAVTLSTIHSSKGLEYDRVLLVDLIDGQFPSKAAVERLEQKEDRTAYEEEVRLCYVAATRARRELCLLGFEEGNRTCRPSRFVRLLTADPKPKPQPDRAGNPALETVRQEIQGYYPVTRPEELEVGTVVLHEVFGSGRVIRMDGGMISWFDGVVTKRFSVQACIKKGNLFLKEQ